MRPHIKDLMDKRDKARDVARSYDKAISALQDVCDHSWGYDGHGHNDSYYTCSHCGKQTSDR